MKAMTDFMRALFTIAVPVRIWLGLLMMINMAVPIFFISTPEGIVTIAAAMAGMITMTIIFQTKGFVRLMGLGHIYWVPLVIWFWMRLDLASSDIPFYYWMWSIIVLNSIAIVIDASDIVRYIKVERAPYVT